jgi:hypothetical protein
MVEMIRRKPGEDVSTALSSAAKKKPAEKTEPWRQKKLADYNEKSVRLLQKAIRRYLGKGRWKKMSMIECSCYDLCCCSHFRVNRENDGEAHERG